MNTKINEKEKVAFNKEAYYSMLDLFDVAPYQEMSGRVRDKICAFFREEHTNRETWLLCLDITSNCANEISPFVYALFDVRPYYIEPTE